MKDDDSLDLDYPFDRHQTASVKWDLKPATSDGRDVLPMWVADMDFPIPGVVVSALVARIEHPIFGYSFLSDSHKEGFTGWQRRRNGWEVDPDWLLFSPGVMPAVRAAILALTEPGESVVIQPPVYYPFFDAIRDNGRVVLENPLVAVGSTYEMDLEHLAASITDRTRLLILCSPHNPVGRVWTVAELTALAEVCLKNGITILSDEIHSDLIREDFVFTPLASISPEISIQTVTATAPTKTFNIAGIASGYVVAEDSVKRRAIWKSIQRLGMDLPNALSLTAAAAAYGSGDQWLDHLLSYLNATYTWFEGEIKGRFSGIGLTSIQGTYLAWLDFRTVMRETGADDSAVRRALFEIGGLWLSDGAQFGTGGQGFQRMNLACPRGTVREGLDRMKIALEALA